VRVKLRVESYNGVHVVVTFFAGAGETLANIGTLRMRTEEYQAIGASMSLGAKAMNGNLVVEHEDEVFREAAMRIALEEKARES